MKIKVGILALQGDFVEHAEVIKALRAEPIFIKLPEQLKGVHALILPGGESTTQLKLLRTSGLFDAIKEFHEKGHPIFGTCAGIILLASEVLSEPPDSSLKLLNVKIARNAYGRQRESFEAPVKLSLNGEKAETLGIFIRAPKILSHGEGVRALGRLREEVVFVREKNVLGATFHPELSGETLIHSYFLKMTKE